MNDVAGNRFLRELYSGGKKVCLSSSVIRLRLTPQCRFRFRLLLALWLLLVELTPAVFAFPLSLVSTAVFDETVLLLAFSGILAFVWTMPSRGGLPALLFAVFEFAPVFLFVSALPQAARAAAAASTNGRAKLRRILCVLHVLFSMNCGLLA